MSGGVGGVTQDGRIGKLTTELGKDKLLLVALTATERLSESYTVTVDAFSPTAQPVHTLLGTPVGVAFATDDGNPHVSRDFAGVLWEYHELGSDDRGHHYRLVLRPTTEFMTLNKRNRIFQNKSVIDIAKSLIQGSYAAQLDGSYEPLDYCVQYQESDFAFVSRLMEYEGIYYYYKHEGQASQLVLVDAANAHPDLNPASVKVQPQSARRPDAPIWSVTERRGLGPAKVTVSDFDFEAPETELMRSKSAAEILGRPTARNGEPGNGAAGSWTDGAEIYDFPAKYTAQSTMVGDRHSAAWLDAHRRRMSRSFAEGALFSAAVGRRLTLAFENGTSTEYLIVATAHDYSGPNIIAARARRCSAARSS
jgi:type VI secretion system secreted protein VgrG